MKKNIVMLGMMTYDDFSKGIDNTNAHILRWLEKRDDIGRILFIDFVQFSFITKTKYWLKNKPFLSNPLTIAKGLTYRLDKINDKIYRLVGQPGNLSGLFKSLELINPEIWSFNPFDVSFLNFQATKKIFYAIDDWSKNPLFADKKTDLEKNYQIIGDQADLVLTPSQKVLDSLWAGKNNTHCIGNGVDTEFYKNPRNTPQKIKGKIDGLLSGCSRPIIGYLGVITPERVDFDLVEFLVSNNPDKTFLFAGPVWGGFDSYSLMSKYKNIKFIGMVYYPEMAYLLSLFDVCVIPHRLSDFIQTMNPKKLYEYLAAGQPVVTTPVNGTEKLAEMIYLAETKEDFSKKITQALDDNSPELMKSRQKSIEPFSWNVIFDLILKIINN